MRSSLVVAPITPPMPLVSNPNPTFPAERLSNLLTTMPLKRGKLIPANGAYKHHENFHGTQSNKQQMAAAWKEYPLVSKAALSKCRPFQLLLIVPSSTTTISLSNLFFMKTIMFSKTLKFYYLFR